MKRYDKRMMTALLLAGQLMLCACTGPSLQVGGTSPSGQESTPISSSQTLEESGIVNQIRYRTKTIPSAGAILKDEDSPEKQQTFAV